MFKIPKNVTNPPTIDKFTSAPGGYSHRNKTVAMPKMAATTNFVFILSPFCQRAILAQC